MALLLAPRGLVITLPGDPRSVTKGLPPTVDTDVLPLGPLSPGAPGGSSTLPMESDVFPPGGISWIS